MKYFFWLIRKNKSNIKREEKRKKEKKKKIHRTVAEPQQIVSTRRLYCVQSHDLSTRRLQANDHNNDHVQQEVS